MGLRGRTRLQEPIDYTSLRELDYPIRDYLRSFGCESAPPKTLLEDFPNLVFVEGFSLEPEFSL